MGADDREREERLAEAIRRWQKRGNKIKMVKRLKAREQKATMWPEAHRQVEGLGPVLRDLDNVTVPRPEVQEFHMPLEEPLPPPRQVESKFRLGDEVLVPDFLRGLTRKAKVTSVDVLDDGEVETTVAFEDGSRMVIDETWCRDPREQQDKRWCRWL